MVEFNDLEFDEDIQRVRYKKSFKLVPYSYIWDLLSRLNMERTNAIAAILSAKTCTICKVTHLKLQCKACGMWLCENHFSEHFCE